MTRQQKKQILIEKLAHFLVDNQAAKSIALHMDHQRPDSDPRPKLAVEWAKLRNASTLMGYIDLPEAIATLESLLA
jgi:hypothetical protein